MIAQSFRYWLADLITGGALADYHDRADSYEARYDGMYRLALAAETKSERLRNSLRTISAMETPKANATVRRMAKVAQEAVKQ